MRLTNTGRALLLTPAIALLCGDSLAPRGCGGRDHVAADGRGPLTCAMTLEGAAIACGGEWTYSGEARTYTVVATGGGTGTPRVTYTVPVSQGASRTGTDIILGSGRAGWARTVTVAGGYEAALQFGTSSGTLRLDRVDLPLGRFQGILIPSSLEGTATPGPTGTTVTLEVAFEALP